MYACCLDEAKSSGRWRAWASFSVQLKDGDRTGKGLLQGRVRVAGERRYQRLHQARTSLTCTLVPRMQGPLQAHLLKPPPNHASPTHVLATVKTGFLRGQLANQQGLQELAHDIQVRVEGPESILGNGGGAGVRKGGR